MPPFVLNIFQKLTVCRFNILPFNYIGDKLNLTDNSTPFSSSFNNSGITSSNILVNMPDIILFYTLIII
jgi:hypothetical protein